MSSKVRSFQVATPPGSPGRSCFSPTSAHGLESVSQGEEMRDATTAAWDRGRWSRVVRGRLRGIAVLLLMVAGASPSAIVAEPDPAFQTPTQLHCGPDAPAFISAHLPINASADELASLLARGWNFRTPEGTAHKVSLSGEIDWELSEGTRSAKFDLNSFKFLSPVLNAYESGKDGRSESDQSPSRNPLLAFSRHVVVDWLRHYSYQADDPSGLLLPNRFAWYDMAVGKRAGVIGYLLRELECRGELDESTRVLLERGARDHLSYLSTPWLLASHNNHGLYQGLGLAALCHQVPDISGCSAALPFAIHQVSTYLESAFTDSGIHREHSPFYHEMLARTLNHVLTSKLGKEFETHESWVRCLAERASANVYWMTAPDGSLLRFGDTDSRKAVLTKPADGASSWGQACKTAVKLRTSNPAIGDFRDAGLVVYRDGV